MANIYAHSLILGRYACSLQAGIMLFVLSDVYIILPEHNLHTTSTNWTAWKYS